MTQRDHDPANFVQERYLVNAKRVLALCRGLSFFFLLLFNSLVHPLIIGALRSLVLRHQIDGFSSLCPCEDPCHC